VRGQRLCEEFEKVCAASRPESTLKAMRTVLEYVGHEVVLRPSMFWFVRDVFRALSRKGLVVPTFDEEELQGLMVDAGKRIPNLHVGWLARLLSKVNEDIEFRRSVAARYREVLNALGARTFTVDETYDPVLLRYPILVANRSGVTEKARARRIELGDWFNSPVHPLATRQDLAKIGYDLGSCKMAEMISEQIVTLPIDRRIRPGYVARTIDFLHDISRAGLLAPPPHFKALDSPEQRITASAAGIG
jgi:perosamine synthetase